MRVLIVEDEPNLGRQLRATLEGAGYAVDLATDGEDGHYLGSTEAMTRSSSISACPRSTASPCSTAGARTHQGAGAGADRARQLVGQGGGLDAGADDYLAKPFQTRS
jgi:two-component system OmpR family response regulator